MDDDRKRAEVVDGYLAGKRAVAERMLVLATVDTPLIIDARQECAVVLALAREDAAAREHALLAAIWRAARETANVKRRR